MVKKFPHACIISFGAANRQHSKRSSAYQDAPCLASSLFSINKVLASLRTYPEQKAFHPIDLHSLKQHQHLYTPKARKSYGVKLR